MRILALGDVVGKATVAYLQKHLWSIRQKEKIDAVVANGENASDIKGLCASDARALLDAGIDLITLGNHTFGMRDIYPVLENETRIIRPANYPPSAPGSGYSLLTVDGFRLLCINVSGRVYLDPLASPFDTVDRILEREKGQYDLAIMDIHAEATSEKLALGYYFDGRVHMMFGTHTHVPTADDSVLPKGTGYVSDLGMCGARGGILGMSEESVLTRYTTGLPARFTPASGALYADAVIFSIDENTKRTVKTERVTLSLPEIAKPTRR